MPNTVLSNGGREVVPDILKSLEGTTAPICYCRLYRVDVVLGITKDTVDSVEVDLRRYPVEVIRDLYAVEGGSRAGKQAG